jgi:hypothetical protein
MTKDPAFRQLIEMWKRVKWWEITVNWPFGRRPEHEQRNCKTDFGQRFAQDVWLCQNGTGKCQPHAINEKNVKVKGKVVPVLSFNWAPRHEGVFGEWRYSSTHSLTSALDGCEWSSSRPGRFTSRERAPGTHWIGSWVDPRAVPDAVVKRNIPSPRRESNPRTPIVQPVAQRYTDWAITALEKKCTQTIIQECWKNLTFQELDVP